MINKFIKFLGTLLDINYPAHDKNGHEFRRDVICIPKASGHKIPLA